MTKNIDHPAQPLLHRARLAASLLAGLIAACGGGGDGGNDSGNAPAASCSVAANKQWLRDYFHGNPSSGQTPAYFWYSLAPNPDPSAHANENSYFDALLHTGNSALFPADRWSFHQSTASFEQFFDAGQTLGYGLSVAGREVVGLPPGQPLLVRYVEPQSPAAGGLRRGDRILSVNGRTAANMISANDFGALAATSTADTITVSYSRNGVAQPDLTLRAAVFALTPLNGAQIVSSPLGRQMGYIQVKHMISQIGAPLAAALATFKAAPVDELAIDLRYNGGGLVSVGRDIASYAIGPGAQSTVYANLLFNDQRTSRNLDFRFVLPASALGLSRVFVLAGSRTCSASEQVINGLRGVGIDVVVIGDTTCGKPVGFQPADNGCGETYSVVNFESVNQLGTGRYFNGFAATCAVAEDFTRPLGEIGEPLLDAARAIADGGACPTVSAGARQQILRAAPERNSSRSTADGERPMMIPR